MNIAKPTTSKTIGEIWYTLLDKGEVVSTELIYSTLQDNNRDDKQLGYNTN